MIDLDSLTFGYNPQNLIFADFSWQVAAGESWAVLGASGCGKTTLLYLLAGLREANSGTVRINGEKLVKPRPLTGLVLQDFGLLPWATVQENVTLGLRIRRFYGPDGKHAPTDEDLAEIEQAGSFWLDKLGLREIRGQYPGQISGGQRQRTAIARTLSLKPDLLLMDEPFASLDAPTREHLQKVMIELCLEHCMTSILITHSIEEAALMGEKILILKGIPNHAPVVIENLLGRSPEYLHSEAYSQMCARLRRELENR
jgi:ABC-type nitrate/sulfonate/bicarbonate transport system ATPase subunit